MKHVLVALAFLASSLCFAQDLVVSGVVKDLDSNNDPLVFAKVSVKETGATVMTDEHGNFEFRNLTPGNYTLVCSFVGYTTVEKNVAVTAGKLTNESLAMNATSLGLDEIMATLATTERADNATSILNN